MRKQNPKRIKEILIFLKDVPGLKAQLTLSRSSKLSEAIRNIYLNNVIAARIHWLYSYFLSSYIFDIFFELYNIGLLKLMKFCKIATRRLI